MKKKNLYKKKLISFNKYKKCISSVFNIDSPDIEEAVTLQYKRIAYFNEMSSQSAFITKKFRP